MTTARRAGFSWLAITRVGLVQAAIGAMVVLTTSVINRVMIVELGLAASIPGLLVAAHFASQLLLRPQVGHWSDQSGRRTRWIAAGMLVLALGVSGAAVATAAIATNRAAGFGLAIVSFLGVGAGASLAGTPLLALLSERVEERRRPSAAATVWLMMIAGFVVATVVASQLLEPFSYGAMVRATAGISAAATLIALLALIGLEGSEQLPDPAAAPADRIPLREAFRAVWGQPAARAFAVFIFVSMLAYSAQDLILEPFGGLVFGLSPADTTRVSSTHQGGMLVGMILAALAAPRIGTLRQWTTAGCVGSAAAFAGLAVAPVLGGVGALKALVPILGIANGVYAVGAVGSMMTLSIAEGRASAGLRMGVFGAAQAIASALGGSAGALGSDLGRLVLGTTTGGYAAVFVIEALLFGFAARFALRSIPAGRSREAARDGGLNPIEAIAR